MQRDRDANICNGYLQNINITTETETEIPSHSRSITSIQPNRGLISNKICMNVKKSSFDIFCDKKMQFQWSWSITYQCKCDGSLFVQKVRNEKKEQVIVLYFVSCPNQTILYQTNCEIFNETFIGIYMIFLIFLLHSIIFSYRLTLNLGKSYGYELMS